VAQNQFFHPRAKLRAQSVYDFQVMGMGSAEFQIRSKGVSGQKLQIGLCAERPEYSPWVGREFRGHEETLACTPMAPHTSMEKVNSDVAVLLSLCFGLDENHLGACPRDLDLKLGVRVPCVLVHAPACESGPMFRVKCWFFGGYIRIFRIWESGLWL
jgi:hypothetical protein